MPGRHSSTARVAGLAEEWDKVKEAYAAANRALGNIVKVTPSSKVVGDLANFMVANGLDDTSLVERAGELTFPTSVIEFMQARPAAPARSLTALLCVQCLDGAGCVIGYNHRSRCECPAAVPGLKCSVPSPPPRRHQRSSVHACPSPIADGGFVCERRLEFWRGALRGR